MNNDDLHLNKIPQQFDYSMQNINNSLNQNDDSCMDLLDKLTYDDNTSNVTIYTPNNMGIKDDDKFTQEIMSALDRKDFDRILTLAISQSNNGNKMGNLLTETIHEIEKNSNKPIDAKIMEKLHSLLRSQPKSIATTTPLRATVAPIRNESIVCSSSSNMSNNTGFRSNKPTKSEALQDDFLSLISSDCKMQSGTRSLPATPPISQVPNRPLSSHCVPIRSNEQRKRQECELDPQIQQIPFCAYGTPQNTQPQMQYVPFNVNQFAQYQPSMMPSNIFVMPVMNQSEQPGAVPQSNPVLTQTGQPGNHNNQISLLLGSPAFFSMPNSGQNQTVTTSHDSGLGNTTNTTVAVRSPAMAPHGSNLPKLLPKPQHPIMPRTLQYASGAMPHQMAAQIAQHQNHLTQPMQSQQNNNQSQTFKRPTNRKSSVKARPSSSRSSKSSKKESNNSSNNNKDNVLMAWEMSGQCGGDEDNMQQSAQSFITELTNGVTSDQFCLIPTAVDSSSVSGCGLEGFCQPLNDAAAGASSHHQEFDDLLDELVTILDVHFAQTLVNQINYECAITRIDPVSQHIASITNMSMLGGAVATCQHSIIPSSNCVVIVRQSPSIDPSALLHRSASSASSDQQRVMQLLYAHLGRHSEILTPLLKCLLPPQQQQQQQQQQHQSSSGSIVVSNTHHSRPLSVCTRMSEQDELTEDDLLADISPVKHDPTKLANLDRFLESCQSISPCSSLMQDYEEHEDNAAAFDDPRMMMMMLLPFQAGVDENYTLQDFCTASRHGGSDTATGASWLRKSKQRNKWTLNGSVIRSSKVLEPPVATSERKREKSLKKKAAFKQCGIISVPTREQKLKRKSKKERRVMKYLEKIRQIKGENNPDVDGNAGEQQEREIRTGSETCERDLLEAAINDQMEDNEGSSCGAGGTLKMRIRLSQLKVVATTIVRSPDPPPPPLVNENQPEPSRPVLPLPPCKQPRRAKMKSNLAIVPPLVQRQAKKHIELNTKRIFCTRKEDRRSSALHTATGANNNSSSSNTSPVKYRKLSPCKLKRGKQSQPIAMPTAPPTLPLPQHCNSASSSSCQQEHPPLILKLCTKRQLEPSCDSPPLSNEQQSTQGDSSPFQQVLASPFASSNSVTATATATATTGRLKLRLKLSASHENQCYSTTQHQDSLLDAGPEEPCGPSQPALKASYEYSPAAPVTLAPPVHHRPRPQLAAFKFSPTHSSSDSDGDGAHNEISSLLQRQEQRDPLSVVSASTNTMIDSSSHHHHHHHHNSFPQLPVPYLVGSDPTVFIDPHEFDLVVVKNSKYKKVSQQRACGGEIIITGNNNNSSEMNGGAANLVDVVSSDCGINNELFVPGCFIEQEKSQMSSWNHSSPSMPVLAPQEPFSTVADNSGKSNHISLSAYDYSQSQINQSSQQQQQQQQPYSDSSDRLQQSPLCMTTSTNPQTSQYSSSQNEMRPDTIKSPYQHQSSYYQQPSYNGSCYLADNSVSAVSATASNNQSKTQIHSSPVASLQTTTGSSHIQDYSNYFQSTSQIQSLASSDTASFSSISLTSSSYQPNPDHQSSKHTTSKRSSSSRSHQSEQTSSKKRKEPSSQPSLQLASYSNQADIYNAAVQYSNFDYYSNGFSDIMGGIDRAKLYEQWSHPLNALCPSNLQWNSAMAEYCKQAASLMPQTGSSGFGLSSNSNPLSLTSNLNPSGTAMDYSSDISHSVDSLKYLDSYTAYAMAQPYMYPTFGGIPK